MLGLDLSASQRLQTTLSQSQQQSLRVLQMSAAELRDEAERLAAENPFLEVDAEAAEPSDAPSEEGLALERADVPLDRLYDRWPGAEESSADPWDASAREETLSEHLRAQMGFLSLADDTRAALLYLIDALDEHGLLPAPLDVLRKEANERIAPDDWRRALEILRSFDPTGVGAFSRGEMLRLQVDELQKEGEVAPQTAEAFRRLTESGLEGLAGLRAPSCGLPSDLRDDLLALLPKLQPNITSDFAEAPVQYVRPDVWVETFPEGGLRFTLLRGAEPVVSLVQSDERAARDENLRELWQEAKAFVRAVEARKERPLRRHAAGSLFPPGPRGPRAAHAAGGGRGARPRRLHRQPHRHEQVFPLCARHLRAADALPGARTIRTESGGDRRANLRLGEKRGSRPSFERHEAHGHADGGGL